MTFRGRLQTACRPPDTTAGRRRSFTQHCRGGTEHPVLIPSPASPPSGAPSRLADGGSAGVEPTRGRGLAGVEPRDRAAWRLTAALAPLPARLSIWTTSAGQTPPGRDGGGGGGDMMPSWSLRTKGGRPQKKGRLKHDHFITEDKSTYENVRAQI